MISADHLTQAARLYGIDAIEPEPIGGFHQNVFRSADREPAWIFKFTPAEQTAALKREVDWVRHLRGRGLSLAPPVASRRGNWVESLDDGETSVTLMVAEEVAGFPPNLKREWERGTDLFEQWGAFLGIVHRESPSFLSASTHEEFPHWNKHSWWGRLTPQTDDELLTRWEQVLGTLEQWPRDTSEYGLIHGDLHHGNFHWHRGSITGFDFGDGEQHWYHYDLAIAVYHALDIFPLEEREQRNALAHDLWQGLRTGYRREHPDSFLSEERLHFWLEYRRLFSYLYLCAHLNRNRITPKQEAYLKAQRQYILDNVPLWDPRPVGQ